MTTLDERWRSFARQMVEPSAAQIVDLVGTARGRGWDDDLVEAELKRFQAKMREEFAPIFTADMVELLIAEMMDSYRKQSEPPSRAVQTAWVPQTFQPPC